jgi:hypothetical protein
VPHRGLTQKHDRQGCGSEVFAFARCFLLHKDFQPSLFFSYMCDAIGK